MRPSGTEPKAKFYVTVNRAVPESASDDELEQQKTDVVTLANDLGDALLNMAKEIAGEPV